MSKSVTTTVCDWVHSVKLEDVPVEVRERTKYLILDGLACGLVASHLTWSETATKTMLTFESAGDCEIWGYNKKVGPLAAAILNSSFIQGFEIDDWHAGAPCHSESIILPAILAAAEYLKASEGKAVKGEDFLLATIVGFEMTPRTGLALYGADLLARGFHSGTLMGHAGSGLACAKILGLDRKQVEHSLGTACTQACGLMSAQYGSQFKRMQHGTAARNGLFAALMSRGGYTGIEQVYDLPYGGFLATFGGGCKKDPPTRPESLVDGLGTTKWEINDIRVKAYATQAGNHAMIDCLGELQALEPVRMAKFSDIQNIHVQMDEVGFKHGCFKGPPPPIEVTFGQMCTAYAAAVKLVDGDVFVASFAPSLLNRPILWEIMDKVSYEHNAEFDGEGVKRSQTKVTVTFSDGEKVVSHVKSAKGIDPTLTNEEILEKYKKLMKLVVSVEESEKLERLVLGIERVEDITLLAGILGHLIKSPFAE